METCRDAFLEKALVARAKRRMHIRMVRLCHSTSLGGDMGRVRLS